MLHLSKSLVITAALLSPASALWPIPKHTTLGNTTLLISQDLTVTYNGQDMKIGTGKATSNSMSISDAKSLVQAAVSRARTGIFQENFVPWKLIPRGKLSSTEPSVPVRGTTYGKISSLSIESSNSSINLLTAPDGDADESYTLDVTAAGKATIKAPTLLGVLHGLETFTQLFYQHSNGAYWYTRSAPVSISDSPEYSHRGIMIDGARNFIPVDNILHTIDAMAWNKMNRLHFHVTDSQSWPLEIPAFPELSNKGAYHSSQVYSTGDVKKIQEYALQRGVQVIMEIDMPGHSGSIALSKPELIVGYNAQPYYWYCAEPPCGAFKLNNTAVYNFLDTLWADVLPRLSPYTAYFHTGGDEVNANSSMLDDGVRSNKASVLRPLIQTFVNTSHKHVRKAGLIPLVWEEMIKDWDLNLGSDVVVQSWLGGNSIKNYTSRGHKVIDSNYGFWYLDCGRGQWLDFDNGAAFNGFYPFTDWCTPTNNWRKMYSYDPRAGLTDDEKKLVLGGEAAVWSETIDSTNFDSLVWPRASAMGEVLWSGRTDASGRNRSQYDASPRLSEMRERMVARGIGASPIQMTFCTQSDNPLDCAYYFP